MTELDIPVLVIAGAHDTPFILAAAKIMEETIRSTQKVIIKDAAHLPNLDHPKIFQKIVNAFLDNLTD